MRSWPVSLFALLIFYIVLQNVLFSYSVSFEHLIVLLFSLLPVLVLWFVFRVVLSPVQTALSISSVVSITSWLSLMKSSETNSPLGWNDIFYPRDLSFFLKYVSASPISVLVAVVVISTLISFLLIKIPKFSSRRTVFSVAALAALLTLIFVPLGKDETSFHVRNYLASQGVYYISWGWDANVSKNGILLHLLHTSIKTIPAKPSLSEEIAYQRLLDSESLSDSSISENRPKNVVLILCESCWWDNQNFSGAVDPLSKIGFKQTSLISPVYGGMTANASLELLSGLAINSQHLGGVIYQEYADILSPKVLNLAWSFHDAGYATVAGHNWNRAFWRRDEIKPKLGFQRFISLEDLEWKGEGYPRDHILFNEILKEVAFDGEGTFLFLTTMFSHSPYFEEGIPRHRVFEEKLSKTAMDIADFASDVLSRDPDALIVVIGDHKPSLGGYFKERGVLPESEFQVGTSRRKFDFSPELWGEVPALVYQSDSMAVGKLLSLSSQKPFFCFNFYLNSVFLGFSNPVQKFIRDDLICERYKSIGYNQSVDLFPEWLYFFTLLEGP